jgi:hypothetical protein
MPITVWERLNIDSDEWQFNHIENGHLTQSKPVGDERQTKNWDRGVWRYKHMYLVDGVVVNTIEG